MAGEKTEKATPKRKQEERKKGNVFLSREVVTVASLLVAFFSLKVLFPFIFTTLQEFIREFIALGAIQGEVTQFNIGEIFSKGAIVFLKAAFPILCIAILVNVLATMAQTKMLFSAKSFDFKGERLDPLKGLKKIISMRSLVELLKSIVKICVLGYILYSTFVDQLHNFPNLMGMQPIGAMEFTGGLIIDIAMKVGVIFIFLTVGDYLYQWWEYERNLKMSKQEIKDEYKQMEGDPQIKSQIRFLQQQRAKQRMMQNVPSADVVIRNPTHYAVAIKYDQSKHKAPVIIAKGADSLAFRIIEVAQKSDVYIVENKPLARALFDEVDLDREIPVDFYEAIAEVLAFVYSIKKKGLK